MLHQQSRCYLVSLSSVFTVISGKVTMSDPIDFIDLTQESPVNKAAGIHMTKNASKLRKHRSCKQQTMFYHNLTESGAASNSSNNDANQNDSQTPVEIIELDDTLSPSHKESKYIGASDSGNVVVLACPICFEKLSSELKPMFTPCGHIFCNECLELSIRNKKKCPKCQRSIRLQTCKRLYF